MNFKKDTTTKLLFCLFILLLLNYGCKNKTNLNRLKNQVEILNISGKEVLNQAIFFDENDSIDYSKSQFHELHNGNCIKYYSFLDTLNLKLGKKRFILFKTSDSLKSDFSNINDITLEEYIFLDKNNLCFERKNKPKYGVIEDIVFLDSDSIINDEKAKRIKTIYQYINFESKLKWIEMKE